LHKMKYRCLAQSMEQTYANVYNEQNQQGMLLSVFRFHSTTGNFTW